MSASIEITGETAQILQEKAAALGLTISDYLRTLAGLELVSGNGARRLQVTPEELDQLIDEVSRAEAGRAATLPEDFSRDDIYADHD